MKEHGAGAGPARSDFIDAYAVLDVPSDVSDAELKRAHRALARRHHPDLLPADQRPAATRRIQQINVAYGLVRDPASRAAYDHIRDQRLRRSTSPDSATVDTVARDRAAAASWEALLAGAGRWAGQWWSRNRGELRAAVGRAAKGAQRTGLDLIGRVVWLTWCAVLGGLGLPLAAIASTQLDGSEVLTNLTGVLGGIAVGHRNGWRLRLRLAHPGRRVARGGTAVAELALWVAATCLTAALTAG